MVFLIDPSVYKECEVLKSKMGGKLRILKYSVINKDVIDIQNMQNVEL